MTIKDKRELVRLLNLYQQDLLAIDDNNARIRTGIGTKMYEYPTTGVKSQYNHARIIATKLQVEIEKDIWHY